MRDDTNMRVLRIVVGLALPRTVAAIQLRDVWRHAHHERQRERHGGDDVSLRSVSAVQWLVRKLFGAAELRRLSHGHGRCVCEFWFDYWLFCCWWYGSYAMSYFCTFDIVNNNDNYNNGIHYHYPFFYFHYYQYSFSDTTHHTKATIKHSCAAVVNHNRSNANIHNNIHNNNIHNHYILTPNHHLDHHHLDHQCQHALARPDRCVVRRCTRLLSCVPRCASDLYLVQCAWRRCLCARRFAIRFGLRFVGHAVCCRSVLPAAQSLHCVLHAKLHLLSH